MSKNTNLHNAMRKKNAEFYTRYCDVMNEMQSYLDINPDLFKDKTILLPCDDHEHSNFTNYFRNNFSKLGIKKLISTCYKANEKGKIQIIDKDGVVNEHLDSNGDFRSKEVTRLKDEADIIITNPPFSLIREFIDWVNPKEKKVCIIGTMNCIAYSNFFPLLRDGYLQIGSRSMNKEMYFRIPDEYKEYLVEHKKEGSAYKIIYNEVMGRLASACFYQNLVDIERPFIELTEEFNLNKYPIYDNYAAVNVNKVKDIPKDYNGLIGVPITFLDKYNPKQFKLIGMTSSSDESPEMKVIKTSDENRHSPLIKGKEIYKRLIIKPLWEEKEVSEKDKVIEELKKYSCEFTCEEELCYIGYNYKAKDLVILKANYIQSDNIYFKDEDTLIFAVNQVGEDRIKKHIFGIE